MKKFFVAFSMVAMLSFMGCGTNEPTTTAPPATDTGEVVVEEEVDTVESPDATVEDDTLAPADGATE